MKALVGAFNQEKALVGSSSVIVKTDGLFAALAQTQASLIRVQSEFNYNQILITVHNQKSSEHASSSGGGLAGQSRTG